MEDQEKVYLTKMQLGQVNLEKSSIKKKKNVYDKYIVNKRNWARTPRKI